MGTAFKAAILTLCLMLSHGAYALKCEFKSNTLLIVECDVKQCTVTDKKTGRTDPEEDDLNDYIREVTGMPDNCKDLIKIFTKIDLHSPVHHHH